MAASSKRPDVVSQSTDRPSLGLHQSHNRGSGTPFICAEYRGCRSRNKERWPDAPNYPTGVRGRQKESDIEIAKPSPCTTCTEWILAIDHGQNCARNEIPLTNSHWNHWLIVENVLVSGEGTDRVIEVVLEGN